MARKKKGNKSRARRERQWLARLKRIHERPWTGTRQGFAPPVKIVIPKKGKGAYKRPKFKRGGDMGNKSNDLVASLIKAIII